MPDPSAPRAPLEVIDPDHYERHGPPHAAWARLRREAPLAWCEGVQGMPPFWAVTRHADLVRFSRDPARFQNAPLVAIFPAEQLTPDEPLLRHLLGMDPPDHRDYRNLLAKHFTPRAIEAKRAAVAAQVDAILDAAMERGEIDFVTDVAAVMPIASRRPSGENSRPVRTPRGRPCGCGKARRVTKSCTTTREKPSSL